MMAPLIRTDLIPRNSEYVTLCGIKYFADVIKLRVLRDRGVILEYSCGSIVITRALLRERGRQGSQRRRCEDGAEVRKREI